MRAGRAQQQQQHTGPKWRSARSSAAAAQRGQAHRTSQSLAPRSQPTSIMEMTFSSSSLGSEPARDHRRRALHMSYQEEKGTVMKGTHDQMRPSCLCSSNFSPSR